MPLDFKPPTARGKAGANGDGSWGLRFRGRYALSDYLTQGYVILVGLIVLFFHGTTVPHWQIYVLVHLSAVAGIDGLIRGHDPRPRNRVLDFARQFYPMLLYGPFFWETAKLNHVFFPGFLDPFFIRSEEVLFGLQPGLEFMASLPYSIVSEVLYAAYFSYYLMIAGMALALYIRSRAQFQHFVTISCVVFYFCYLCYISLPVVGPLIFFRAVDGYVLPAAVFPAVIPPFPVAIQGGAFYRLMDYIYVPFEAPGASFPSSHVAIAIVTLYFSFKYLRPIRWPHFILVILLCASTVYGRYHYAVDVLGGGICAALLIPLGNKLYFRAK